MNHSDKIVYQQLTQYRASLIDRISECIIL